MRYTFDENIKSRFTLEATGIMDSKFEYSYLVTMKVDPKTVHGVFYHPQHNVIIPNNMELNTSKRSRTKRRNGANRPDPKLIKAITISSL
uniref:Uncharacterized protein n=1 Tax=Lactuca sativa TaxID=4236 RepID=A0A9R1WUR4_LACSA|nr:hypothetical protein LSAT_V11C900472870 [Lactuca sativa]